MNERLFPLLSLLLNQGRRFQECFFFFFHLLLALTLDHQVQTQSNINAILRPLSFHSSNSQHVCVCVCMCGVCVCETYRCRITFSSFSERASISGCHISAPDPFWVSAPTVSFQI